MIDAFFLVFGVGDEIILNEHPIDAEGLDFFHESVVEDVVWELDTVAIFNEGEKRFHPDRIPSEFDEIFWPWYLFD